MGMTERDLKILKKITENQNELASFVKEFQITTAADLSKVHPAVRRGIIGFVGDPFELTRPLTNSTKSQLPLNQTVIKQFRNTASHQYGIITDAMAHACLMHCIDKNLVRTVKDLINNFSSNAT